MKTDLYSPSLELISPWDLENEDCDYEDPNSVCPTVKLGEKRREDILSCIKENEGKLSSRDIYEKTECYVFSSALEYLDDLEKKGLITKNSEKKWCLVSPDTQPNSPSNSKKSKRKKTYKNQRGSLIAEGIRSAERKRGKSVWIEHYYCYRTLKQEKKRVYVPLKIVEQVRQLEREKRSVVNIISFIKGELPYAKV